MMRWTLPVAACVLAAACAPSTTRTVPSAQPTTISERPGGLDVHVENSGTVSTARVEATPDQVWAVLPMVYRDAGLEVTMSDPGNQTMGSVRTRLPRTVAGQRLSRFLDCGVTGLGTPMVESYRVQGEIRTTVVAVEGGSELRTFIVADAQNPTRPTDPTSTCTSTGRLEALLAENVRMLAPAATPVS